MPSVLIVGGSRGIGAAIVEIFAQNKWDTTFTYMNSRAEAQCMQSAFGTRAIFMDVCDPEGVAAALDGKKYFDAVIYCAGISQQILFTDITPVKWREMMAVHVDGLYNVLQNIVPEMVGRKSGSIIVVSSVWGITGASCEVHYSTAKAAQIGMCKALAKELGPSGIRVNSVAPGMVQTDMNSCFSQEEIQAFASNTPLCRIGQPDEVANLVYFLAGENSSFITGQVISPNGGIVI